MTWSGQTCFADDKAKEVLKQLDQEARGAVGSVPVIKELYAAWMPAVNRVYDVDYELRSAVKPGADFEQTQLVKGSLEITSNGGGSKEAGVGIKLRVSEAKLEGESRPLPARDATVEANISLESGFSLPDQKKLQAALGQGEDSAMFGRVLLALMVIIPPFPAGVTLADPQEWLGVPVAGTNEKVVCRIEKKGEALILRGKTRDENSPLPVEVESTFVRGAFQTGKMNYELKKEGKVVTRCTMTCVARVK